MIATNWKQIVKRAWSIRFLIVAGILTALETVLPIISEVIPPRIYSTLIGGVIAAAFVARIVSQKDFDRE